MRTGGASTRAGISDSPWVVAVFLATLGLYWATLAPGLLGLIDTPKFQFVGSVLGVPHAPGYPVYVLLSYGFSHLPFGNLAYRINFMSAVFGALTVALIYLCGRQARCSRPISAIGAVGLGSGQLFWGASVVAEVYTLHTALLAAILLSLMRWATTRSATAYYTAVACVAVSVGHHTTMVLLAPAFAAYVLLVDARYALRPRRLALVFAVLTLGLVPYAFIAVRTLQGAPFVETPIASVADGAAAVLSRRWQSSVFAFDVQTLLRERIPFVVMTLARELSWVGLIVAGGGGVYLLKVSRPLAVLLGGAGLLNLLFVLVYDIEEIAVFLLPTALTGWLCATILVGHARLLPGLRLGRVGITLVAVALVGWTGWHVNRGFVASDRSREFQEIRRFDALFQGLPPQSVIVSNDYVIDSMLRYKLLGEEAAGQRNIRGPVPPDPEALRQLHRAGVAVFAFAQQAVQLRLNGFRFAEAPLFESVAQHLNFAPDGTVIAIASTPATSHLLSGTVLNPIAGGGPLLSQRTHGGVVGVVNADGVPLEDWRAEGLRMELEAGDQIGTTGAALPTRLAIRTDSTVNRIAWGDGRSLEGADGAVLVELNPDGTLREAHVIDPDTRNGVALDQRRRGYGLLHIPDLSLFRLLDTGRCEEVSSREWIDIGALAQTGKLSLSLAVGTAMTIYVGRHSPLDPRLTFVSAGSELDLETQLFALEDASEATLRRELARDDIRDISDIGDASVVYRMTVNSPVLNATGASATLVFGGIPDFAVARRDSAGDGGARVCTATLGYDGLFGDPSRRVEQIDWTRAGDDELLGAGWYGRYSNPTRWASTRAELLLPLWRTDSLRLSITARPSTEPSPLSMNGAPVLLELELNGQALGRHPVRGRWDRYEWELPSTVADTGLNQAFLNVLAGEDGTYASTRERAVEVRDVTLSRRP